MRIDSGKFKGRKLIEKKYEHIRPTTDKVRQALFVKLQFFLEGKKVLDLCCGTGAMGIEALSRGAEEVIFVDKDFRSVELTKLNLSCVGAVSKVYKRDACSYIENCNDVFDLIIFDPPYKSGLYDKVIPLIFEKNILSEDGILVCEHSSNDKIDIKNFKLLDEKKYGDITLTYLTK